LRTRQPPRVWGALLVGAGALALVSWLAYPAVQARLSTLWRGDALHDGRLQLWARVLPFWREFPVWGAGYGTFTYLELLGRQPGQDRSLYYDHADNDYVQLLVEGGAVGLALALLAVLLLYRSGVREVLQGKVTRLTGLALGGLFALTTVVVHSFFDYGLHVPAVTLLAAAIAAQLTGLRARKPSQAPSLQGYPVTDRQLPLGRLAPLLGVAAALAVAFVLVHEGWCADKAEQYRLAAEHCKSLPGETAQERRRTYLQAAVALAPDNALLQLELAEAYHDAFERTETVLASQAQVRRACEIAWVGSGLAMAAQPTPLQLPWTLGLVLRDAAGRETDRLALGRSQELYLKPSLRYFVRARNLCPLFGHTHVRLATYAGIMARADSRELYLRRAARLLPHDERIWFVCGVRALEEGQPEQAWPCWRRCLECSPRYLKQVMAGSSQQLTPQDLVKKVLPADPLLIYQAAQLLADQPNTAATQEALLDAALQLFEQQAGTLTIVAEYARARCHQLLGHTPQALQAYKEVVERAPEKTAWRYEFIQLLLESGRVQEARRELVRLLQQEPGNRAANDLYNKVLELIAAGQ
jgi:tetratricopeptide (TPR) repeat protein